MAEPTIIYKLKKFLYGMGLKHFGPEVLADIERGSPDWIEFASGLIEANDLPTRKEMIRQLTAKGTLENSVHKRKLIDLLLEYLDRGHGDEKRTVLRFIGANLKLFPADDDRFQAKIMALSRHKDPKLHGAAGKLMEAMGHQHG